MGIEEPGKWLDLLADGLGLLLTGFLVAARNDGRAGFARGRLS